MTKLEGKVLASLQARLTRCTLEVGRNSYGGIYVTAQAHGALAIHVFRGSLEPASRAFFAHMMNNAASDLASQLGQCVFARPHRSSKEVP